MIGAFSFIPIGMPGWSGKWYVGPGAFAVKREAGIQGRRKNEDRSIFLLDNSYRLSQEKIVYKYIYNHQETI